MLYSVPVNVASRIFYFPLLLFRALVASDVSELNQVGFEQSETVGTEHWV